MTILKTCGGWVSFQKKRANIVPILKKGEKVELRKLYISQTTVSGNKKSIYKHLEHKNAIGDSQNRFVILEKWN